MTILMSLATFIQYYIISNLVIYVMLFTLQWPPNKVNVRLNIQSGSGLPSIVWSSIVQTIIITGWSWGKLWNYQRQCPYHCNYRSAHQFFWYLLIVKVGEVCSSDKGKILVVMHHYAYKSGHQKIHSSTQVDDRSIFFWWFSETQPNNYYVLPRSCYNRFQVGEPTPCDSDLRW